MSQTWAKVLIPILLKGNFIKGSAAAVAAAYDTALLSDAVLTDGGGEFSFKAICDRVLQAMSLIITAIGENRQSQYRTYFLEDTTAIASGEKIPTSVASKTRYGVISDVKDGTTNAYLTETPRELVLVGRKTHSRIITKPFQYYTDDVRLWHTRTAAKCEIVAWNRAVERSAMITTNNVSVCSLPEDLLPALEFGSLASLSRNNFNAAQADKELPKFIAELNRIAGKPIADAELAAKL